MTARLLHRTVHCPRGTVLSLVPCTPNPIEGCVLPGFPSVEVHEDVLYNPVQDHAWHDDPLWGIYGPDGRLIDAAAYYRGPGSVTLGQSPAIDLAAMPAADIAPDATYIYGGIFIEHIGHFLTSSLGRLWPFLDGGAGPVLGPHRILCHGVAGPDHWFSFPYMAEPLAALGLARDRFASFTRPTRIRRLIVPRPSFEEHNFVHAAYASLARTVGTWLLGDPPCASSGRGGPLVLSRSRYPVISQGFENEPELEARLAALGVPVAYPEELTLAGQIRLFQEHRVVAGTLSSAFHLAAFCPAPPRLILLSPTPVVNPNFSMLDRACGLDARYFQVDASFEGISATGRIRNRFRINNPDDVARQLLAMLQEACTLADQTWLLQS